MALPPIRPIRPLEPSDIPPVPPEAGPAGSTGQISRERLARLEDRLRILESAFVKNAVELREQVARRLDRIEHCVEGKAEKLREEFGEGAFDFTREESWDRSPKPPVKVNGAKKAKRTNLPPGATVRVDGSAVVSLGEFNDSLRSTREQLEDLGRSIGDLKVELSS